jgi:hypothetical protein
MPQIFTEWQAEYAARGLPTFPINPIADGGKTKRPSVPGYTNVTLDLSRQYAFKFTKAKGIACMAGARNRLLLIDVDARGADADRLAADAQCRYGRSRFITRTGRDGRHLYYRWNGEARKIRPDPSCPIDILGGGVVVLPPSIGAERPYEIIEGHLDDLTALTTIKSAPTPPDIQGAAGYPADARHIPRIDLTGMRDGDGRNRELFNIMCDNGLLLPPSLEAFIDFAREKNMTCAETMTDNEVIKVANSVFKYRMNGTLRPRQRGGVWFPPAAAPAQMIQDNLPLFGLIAWLKAMNGPDAEFWVADGLREKLGWSDDMLSKARRDALNGGWIVQIAPPAPRRPARYRWGPTDKRGGREERGVSIEVTLRFRGVLLEYRQ